MPKKIKIGVVCLGLVLVLLALGMIFRDELEYYWYRNVDPLWWELKYTLSGCDKLQEKIRQQIEAVNYCQTDEDCTIEFFDCPFGCGSYVNKRTNIAQIKEQVSSYHQRCGRCEYKCLRLLNPVCQNQKCVETQALCQPDKVYEDIWTCHCPEGTDKSVYVPRFDEEGKPSLICRTISTCKGEAFYEKQAMSLDYKVYRNYVTVSGCISIVPGEPCQEKTIELSGLQGFYLPSGKEQSVYVRLEKIENNKAYFVFSYGAAPPACETVGGCDYTCQFVKE